MSKSTIRQPVAVPAARLARRGFLVAIAAMTVACSSIDGIQQEPRTAGRARTYDAPLERVATAAKKSILDLELVLEETEREPDGAWLFVAGNRATAWSWGHYIRIIAEPTSATSTTVRIITEKKSTNNVTAEDDLSEPIFTAIEGELGGAAAKAAPATAKP